MNAKFSTALLAFSFLILCVVSASYAASFDCTKATTLVEKAICSDKQLSELDSLLMQSYKKALANSSDSNTLKSEQRTWLINIRNKCQDSTCLKSAYNNRLAVLNGTSVSGAHTSGVVKGTDDDYTGEYSKKNGGVSVQIISKNQIKFFINTVVGMNPCNIGEDGGVVATFIDKNRATFKGEDNCVVEFKFEKNKLKIATKNCDGYCGLNAAGSMDGEYIKKSSKPHF